jgi:hypothetical protein
MRRPLVRMWTRTIVLMVALATLSTALVASAAWAIPPTGGTAAPPGRPETPPGRPAAPPGITQSPPARPATPPGNPQQAPPAPAPAPAPAATPAGSPAGGPDSPATPARDAETRRSNPDTPPGGVGQDVSHPQCGGTLPANSAFGIVGINKGRPFSTNPCFTAQYQWASARPFEAAVYVNTSNPAPSSADYWPQSGAADPALCKDGTSRTDPGCAYDYGWHAAADALDTAMQLDDEVTRHIWWLDVETANIWQGDSSSNTAMLQGMDDYLLSHGVAEVGLYSTGYQWRKITGGYTSSSADGYRAAWRSQFTPLYPLDAAPLWIATYGNTDRAKTTCSTSFTGGRTKLVQFSQDNGFDTNLAC